MAQIGWVSQANTGRILPRPDIAVSAGPSPPYLKHVWPKPAHLVNPFNHFCLGILSVVLANQSMNYKKYLGPARVLKTQDQNLPHEHPRSGSTWDRPSNIFVT